MKYIYLYLCIWIVTVVGFYWATHHALLTGLYIIVGAFGLVLTEPSSEKYKR